MRDGVLQPELRFSSSARVSLSKKKFSRGCSLVCFDCRVVGGWVGSGDGSFP